MSDGNAAGDAEFEIEYPRYPARYPAVYTDPDGSEETVIIHDGEELRMRLRGVEFEGLCFDDWEPVENTDPELFERFQLEPGRQELRDFTLTCEIPVPLATPRVAGPRAGISMAILRMRLELGPQAPNGGAEYEKLEFELVTDDEAAPIESEPDIAGFFEYGLLSIQKQLPENTFIKTCINCDLSDYSPYGQGLFGNHMACFRDIPDEYRAVDSKAALFRVWDKMTEYVSELHLCPKFALRVPGRGYRG